MKRKTLPTITASLVLLILAVLVILVAYEAPQSEEQVTEESIEIVTEESQDTSKITEISTVKIDPEQISETTNELGEEATSLLPLYENGLLDTSEFFTERDLQQSPSLEEATTYTVTSDSDIHITEEGTYILTGTASNVTIYIEADDEAKIQLVLDELSIVNADFPCIYVISGDKIWITTIGDSALCVTGSFRSDGDTNTDGVIFSRSDVVMNGTASLTINSYENGVVSKDDLKVTGGTYLINAGSKALEANDSIRIADGTLNLTAGTDGLHAENDEDDALGIVYICGGTLNIEAGDDGIHGTSVVQIDEGLIDISAAEGIEGTCIQINDGTINISSWDDGINAANKSSAYTTGLEINGGTITIDMGQGDTDGIDSNGNLTVNGGTIDITGMSGFDVDGVVEYNGGTIIFDGQEFDYIPNQGGMSGGHRGMW